MVNPNLGRVGFAIGEQNRNLIFAWYQKNPCALQSDCVKSLRLSKSAVNRGTRAIRDGWRPTDTNKAYSSAAWGVATLHLGSFSPIVGPLAGHIDDLVDESVKAARNDALDEAAYVAMHACLAPPDGGSPTEAEADLCDEADKRIRALKSEKENE